MTVDYDETDEQIRFESPVWWKCKVKKHLYGRNPELDPDLRPVCGVDDHLELGWFVSLLAWVLPCDWFAQWVPCHECLDIGGFVRVCAVCGKADCEGADLSD